MVLYTVIWGPKADIVVLPTCRLYHSFSGKRVRIKLLSWSGSINQDAYAVDSGISIQPIRIDLGDELQANGMPTQMTNTADIFSIYTYPTSFFVDPIQSVQSPDDPSRQVPLISRLTWKAPTIEGRLVGNTLSFQLNSTTVPRGQTPDSHYMYIYSFRYYKAEFDIEEIQ